MKPKTPSTAKVVIVDYGTGNLHSVKKALDRMTQNPVVSSCAKEIEDADKIILPGVGHFGTTMSNLNRLGIIDALNEAALGKRKPTLGICLGMELMSCYSEEGNTRGLGWIDAVSVKFRHSDTERYKVPHVGWNNITVKRKSRLMEGVDETSEFYFAHSYYLKLNDESCLLSETGYEAAFASAVEMANIFGVQFHPEKSHEAGRRVLQNFIEL